MSIYAAITFPLLAVTSRFEECAGGLTGTVAELRDYAFCYGHLTTFKTGITGTYFKTTYDILQKAGTLVFGCQCVKVTQSSSNACLQ